MTVKSNLMTLLVKYLLITLLVPYAGGAISFAQDKRQQQGPPPVPVRVAVVERQKVSDQISLIGTAEAVAESTVASEVSGVVEYFPLKEGDFVKQDDLLVRLKSTYLKLRLKGMHAARDSIQANLEKAEKELSRFAELKKTRSIAEKNYDNAYYDVQALSKTLLQREAEIEQLEYDIRQKEVRAPFSGFIAKEHTQVGEWINPGGPVVTLLNLSKIQITVDVPERYAVTLSKKELVRIVVGSVSTQPITGGISAILPKGDSNSRTFPVRIRLDNPGYKIKSGMESLVTFNLRDQKDALLVPKDAIVTSGNDRLVYMVADGRVIPAGVKILGYYDGNVAIAGNLKAGDQVVTRGNERLRPGQPVQIQK